MEQQSILRDFVNTPHIHARLQQDPETFLIVCASMDLLGDADTAFAEYEQRNNSTGYLELIGVYQAVQWTVEALRRLQTVFGLPTKKHQALENLAEERAKIVGHPISRGKNKQKTITFINRSSISAGRFKAQHVVASNSPTSVVEYSLTMVIQRARQARDIALTDLIETIKNQDREWRKSMSKKTLSGCFHASTGWMLQHIAVVPYADNERNRIVSTDVSILVRQIRCLQNLLIEIGLDRGYPELIDACVDASDLLAGVGRLVESNCTDRNQLLAFSKSSVLAVEELMKSASEIDNDLFGEFAAAG